MWSRSFGWTPPAVCSFRWRKDEASSQRISANSCVLSCPCYERCVLTLFFVFFCEISANSLFFPVLFSVLFRLIRRDAVFRKSFVQLAVFSFVAVSLSLATSARVRNLELKHFRWICTCVTRSHPTRQSYQSLLLISRVFLLLIWQFFVYQKMQRNRGWNIGGNSV